jgi:hypothetical protein
MAARTQNLASVQEFCDGLEALRAAGKSVLLALDGVGRHIHDAFSIQHLSEVPADLRTLTSDQDQDELQESRPCYIDLALRNNSTDTQRNCRCHYARLPGCNEHAQVCKTASADITVYRTAWKA